VFFLKFLVKSKEIDGLSICDLLIEVDNNFNLRLEGGFVGGGEVKNLKTN